MTQELAHPFRQQIDWCLEVKGRALESLADFEKGKIEKRNGQDITAELVTLYRDIVEKMSQLIAAYERLP